MKKSLLVFPGQGSQVVGMGKTVFDQFPIARQVFEEVEDVLNVPLKQMILEGPQDQLNLTENTQPALMCVSAAFLKVMESEFGFNVSDHTYVAGHSLGEYTALYAAGVINLAQAAKLLKKRGQAMQEAVPVGRGKMIAVLGLTMEEAESVVAIVQHELPNKVCALANDNSPGQYVLSGHAQAIDLAMQVAKDKGAKRCLPLPVSAPFHSPLMEPAALTMQEAIEKEDFTKPVVPVLCNVTARSEDNPERLKKNLIDQVCGRVRWTETVQFAAADGIECSIEIGAGKVLSGLIRRIEPKIETGSINDMETLVGFFNKK
jgi:[acyl-carrier-protein] S-malonyltransferase